MIPDEKVSVNTFSIIGDKLQEQLRSLISAKIDENDSAPFNMAKQLYKACMNKSLIEERGLKPLFDITDTLGGWPVVKGNEWDSRSEWTWTSAVKMFRKIGYSMDYIFDFSIGIDLKKSTSRIIDVSRFFGIKQCKSHFAMWLDTFHLIAPPIGIENCTNEEKYFLDSTFNHFSEHFEMFESLVWNFS